MMCFAKLWWYEDAAGLSYIRYSWSGCSVSGCSLGDVAYSGESI
jgi:hypothetical protein